MDGFQICKEIVGLHDGIVSAEIAEKGVTVAAHAKSGSFAKLERLLVQTELLINILQVSQELGRPHYIMAHNDNSDVYFFPITVNGRKMILAMMVAVPHEQGQVTSKIREYIGRLRLAETH
jgi:hypothetical protein